MSEINRTPASIDEYIRGFPPNVQTILESVREAIRAAAPDATERISYGMPTFALEGNLVHFAAHKSHIGFYPTPSGIERFADRLAGFVTSKGAVQFPMDTPIPLELVAEIVRYRVDENRARAEERRRKR